MPKLAIVNTGLVSSRIRAGGIVEPEDGIANTIPAFEKTYMNTATGDVHNWRIVPVNWDTPPVFQQFVGTEEIIFTIFTAPRTDGLTT